MEETADGLEPLEAIRPPRLEDAGLEDCALPPEAIQEAFFRAANSVQSWVIAPDHDEEEHSGCLAEEPRVCEKSGSFQSGEEQEAADESAAAAADAGVMEGELWSSHAPRKACEGGHEWRKNEEDRGDEAVKSHMAGEAPA